MKWRFRFELVNDLASGDLMPTITGYAQALYSVYNAKRISMNGRRWNPFGMEGADGLGIEVAMFAVELSTPGMRAGRDDH